MFSAFVKFLKALVDPPRTPTTDDQVEGDDVYIPPSAAERAMNKQWWDKHAARKPDPPPISDEEVDAIQLKWLARGALLSDEWIRKNHPYL